MSWDKWAARWEAALEACRRLGGTTWPLIIAEPANGSTSFDQFISAEGPDGYKWFKQSADTIYHYGSSAVEAFDKVYQRAASASYAVVDIEPPYVNAPHYKGEQKQERGDAAETHARSLKPNAASHVRASR